MARIFPRPRGRYFTPYLSIGDESSWPAQAAAAHTPTHRGAARMPEHHTLGVHAELPRYLGVGPAPSIPPQHVLPLRAVMLEVPATHRFLTLTLSAGQHSGQQHHQPTGAGGLDGTRGSPSRCDGSLPSPLIDNVGELNTVRSVPMALPILHSPFFSSSGVASISTARSFVHCSAAAPCPPLFTSPG